MFQTQNIITLCGSTKFKKQFLDIQKQLTLKGYLVISLYFFGHSGDDEAWKYANLLEKLHKQKIDLSSSIYVIDVDNYIGNSTQNEINYAISQNKNVYYYSQNDIIHLPNFNL